MYAGMREEEKVEDAPMVYQERARGKDTSPKVDGRLVPLLGQVLIESSAKIPEEDAEAEGLR